jgi:hypothetical protein
MPFDDQFFEVYEMIKMEFSDEFEFSHAGEEGNQQNILKDIIQPIFEADVILADLTGLNSNVLYELGIAHTFNKKTIVMTQNDMSSLPFDLKQYRAKDYSTHFKKFAQLINYLRTNLRGAVDGSVAFSNPVKDFLSLEKIEANNWLKESSKAMFDDSEKGFIDQLIRFRSGGINTVTTKNVLGLLAVSIFAIKGGYRLYKMHKNETDYTQTLVDVGKDAMDGINDIVEIFSDDKREVEMCNTVREISKGGLDILTAVERRW